MIPNCQYAPFILKFYYEMIDNDMDEVIMRAHDYLYIILPDIKYMVFCFISRKAQNDIWYSAVRVIRCILFTHTMT